MKNHLKKWRIQAKKAGAQLGHMVLLENLLQCLALEVLVSDRGQGERILGQRGKGDVAGRARVSSRRSGGRGLGQRPRIEENRGLALF